MEGSYWGLRFPFFHNKCIICFAEILSVIALSLRTGLLFSERRTVYLSIWYIHNTISITVVQRFSIVQINNDSALLNRSGRQDSQWINIATRFSWWCYIISTFRWGYIALFSLHVVFVEHFSLITVHNLLFRCFACIHVCNNFLLSIYCAVSPNLEDGSLVTGTIDAKFDFGYLITVYSDSGNLQGVLYHNPVAPNVFPSHTSSADPAQSIRKRQHLAFKDPAHPKPNRSGYNFFFAEHYGRLKPLYHGQERDISKKIGELWNGLTEAEKQVL